MNKYIYITLVDNTVKEYKLGVTPIEVAKDIFSEKNIDKLLSASINDNQIELYTPIYANSKLCFYTWEDELGKKAFWHSSAHLLAQAILELYPQVKLSIGPAINNGFYYDIDFVNTSFTEKDFSIVEKIMIKNAKKASRFKVYNISKIKALSFYKDNIYKTELIRNIKDKDLTFCTNDNFTDLCRGGHIPNTAFIKYIKLINISGVYWRGNKNNKQLTRIYGISFPNEFYFKKYLYDISEYQKRDHRKLGKKLGLFTFSKRVGSGLPLWLPKGTLLRKLLEEFLTKLQQKIGYEMVITPHIGHKDLYTISGHLDKYMENSFKSILTPNSEDEFILKPMNCPHHCEIYRSHQWSYKDLPKRFAEFGTVYRYEQSGELHGLTRVRSFTQDDAHIFCTSDQLLNEFKLVIDLVIYILNSLGFKEYTAQISLRDYNNTEKYIGTNENWQKAEEYIIKATKEKKLKTKLVYGEAAFYGPKLDFIVKDALGRNWQLGTIQVDYNMPIRFDLNYKGYDNKLHRPIMIHRAPFGSLERFIAILIEHTGGDFPLWLAPYQVSILTISKKYIVYAKNIYNIILSSNIRVFMDDRDEKIGKKILYAEISKIPIMIIIGYKEEKNKSISIRRRGSNNIEEIKIEKFLNFIKKELT
ncbi:MAG: threonine--tRNA ligase [Candidatus Bostrichicola ureolyticus]|nr:MAG: threonine--tRNA ligase [Candidatus Bostrichicola ureolyticus]